MMRLFSKSEKSKDNSHDKTAALLAEKERQITQLEKKLMHMEEENSALSNKLEVFETENTRYKRKVSQLEYELNKEQKNYAELMDLFGYENQNLKSALLDLQKNMSNSTNRAKESLKSSKTVEENFEKAFNDINVIIDNLNDLMKRSNNIASVIKGLSKKAVEIEKSAEMINEVVMQIKILSLNASVEAASAGEAGKGFAVVATEVKNLANKTSAVATQIKNAVKAIQHSTKNTDQEFNLIDNNIQVIHNNTNNFSTEIYALNDLTQHSFAELNILGDTVFMSLAKLDHVIWKVNTYISTHKAKPAFDFVDHHNCRLGKWYYEGDGHKYFSHTANYTKLDKPHSGVHNGTHRVFNLIQQKPLDIAEVKKAFESIEENSREVFTVLDNIMEEVLHQEKREQYCEAV